MPQVLYTSSVILSVFIVPVALAWTQPTEATARPGPRIRASQLIATESRAALRLGVDMEVS
jgi:hypothetical protein